MPDDDDKPMDRRRFFRQGLRGLLDNVGKVAGPLGRVMKELETVGQEFGQLASGAAESPAPARPSLPTPPKLLAKLSDERILRPPGAKANDDDFVATCSTCRACVGACPVHAIRIDPARGQGVPFVIAEDQPCVLCDGLSCLTSCPTGAITAVPIGLIDMGTAEWRPDTCVRSDDTDCTICVDRCPIGPRAIELVDGRVVVHEDGCTGCGVCEHECPTRPRSIVVIPRAMRDRTEKAD